MTDCRDTWVRAGMEIPKEAIGLPTEGGKILSVEKTDDTKTGGRTGAFWRVTGSIAPVDPEASPILFQAGLPLSSNGKLIQFGGGGCDGILFPVEYTGHTHGRDAAAPSPLKDGYAVCCCDGGHTSIDLAHPDMSKIFSFDFALNRETLVNFAYAAQKKVRDAVVWLMEQAYGAGPEKIYYYGGSNGGRECLKTLEHFPEDYDGAICYFPVLWWVLKILADDRNARKALSLGEAAFFTPEDAAALRHAVMKHCDGLDGKEDGLICDFAGAVRMQDTVRQDLEGVLTPAQLSLLDTMASPMRVSFPLGYGTTELPGYAVYQGSTFGPTQTFGGSDRLAFAKLQLGIQEEGIAKMFLQDPDADLSSFDPAAHEEELSSISALMDAYGVQLDAFHKKGGKILLLQGLEDAAVTPEGTIRYYRSLAAHYGQEELDTFLRFYLIPGYGHAGGENFLADVDCVSALDDWVMQQKAPGDLVCRDCNAGHDRSIVLTPYRLS